MTTVITINRYDVDRIDMEGPCPNCGHPVFEDDSAYELVQSEYIIEAGFCSRFCAHEFASNEL